jgi:hypothetical protein
VTTRAPQRTTVACAETMRVANAIKLREQEMTAENPRNVGTLSDNELQAAVRARGFKIDPLHAIVAPVIGRPVRTEHVEALLEEARRRGYTILTRLS